MSGFSFGSPAPTTTAPSSGFSFGGSTTPAAAATTSGFTFGGSSTPAPAAGTSTGFSFGGSAAPSSSGFSFGGSSTPAFTPAPPPTSVGFSFATPSASAPSSSSLFGGTTTSPATKSSGLFGGFGGSTGSIFQTQQQSQQQQSHISMNTPFSALPPNTQKIISDTFMLLYQHKQTMNSVASMSPFSLIVDKDAASGKDKSEIELRQQDLEESISSVQQQFTDLVHKVDKVQKEASELYSIVHECGIYPVQTIAARKRITLPDFPTMSGVISSKDASNPLNASISNMSSDVVQKLNTMLRENATNVDRMEPLPSNYLLNLIDDMDTRLQNLGKMLTSLDKNVRSQQNLITGKGSDIERNPAEELSLRIQCQVDMLIRVANIIGRVDQQLNVLKHAYKEKIARERLMRSPHISRLSSSVSSVFDMTSMVDSSNFLSDPFLDADRKEAQEQLRIQMEVRKRNINARANIPAMNLSTGNTSVAAISSSAPNIGLTSTPSSGGGLFGSKPAATGLFGGSSTPATSVTAPSSGFSFGSPAPTTTAPSNGFSFGGSTTPAAAATTSGFTFGGSSTPAPAAGTSTGFSFGGSAVPSSTPAAAPVSSGFSFGGSSTPSSTTGSSFGGAPTPSAAPSSGSFSFGGGLPAPSTSGLFGTTPASTDAPSRSNVRLRRAGRKR